MRALEKASESSGHSDREVNLHSLATKSAYIDFLFLEKIFTKAAKSEEVDETG